ncbi:MAG TPA: hypothetical protein VGL66_02030 [Caulobacteraceae bacterium]
MTRAARQTAKPKAQTGYERQDAPPKAVVYALAAVFVLIAVTAGLMFTLYRAIEAERRVPPPTPLERLAQVPPPPRLEAYPKRDLAAVRAQAQARLTGYGWSDRRAGLAHIPIERAMQLQAQRGWTDKPAGTAR